jgi:hypothetical protein
MPIGIHIHTNPHVHIGTYTYSYTHAHTHTHRHTCYIYHINVTFGPTTVHIPGRERHESQTRGDRLDAALAKSEEKHSQRGDRKAGIEQKRRTRRRRSMALLTASNKNNSDPDEKPTIEWVEEVVEAGPPLDGLVLKLAVKSQRNWKMRYVSCLVWFVLRLVCSGLVVVACRVGFG